MTDITTPEALDALPVGSVVLDGMGDAWQHSDAHTYWWAPANPFYDEADAANVLEQGGTEHPATLIHRPDRPSDLAAEVERLRAGIEALDLDILEDVAFNLGHTVYEATATDPAECTDECEACCIEDTVTRLRALLAGTR